jgi:hypothetical protein
MTRASRSKLDCFKYTDRCTDVRGELFEQACKMGLEEEVWRETASEAKSDRVQLRRVLAQLGSGDVLLVTRLDRLARSSRRRRSKGSPRLQDLRRRCRPGHVGEPRVASYELLAIWKRFQMMWAVHPSQSGRPNLARTVSHFAQSHGHWTGPSS